MIVDSGVSSTDDTLKEKVKTLIELSRKTEEEVCLALHECDNDLNRAGDMLLEEQAVVSFYHFF